MLIGLPEFYKKYFKNSFFTMSNYFKKNKKLDSFYNDK